MTETELLIAAGCRVVGPQKRWNVLKVKMINDATLRLPVDDLHATTVGGVTTSETTIPTPTPERKELAVAAFDTCGAMAAETADAAERSGAPISTEMMTLPDVTITATCSSVTPASDANSVAMLFLTDGV